jgi:hypothetical protein
MVDPTEPVVEEHVVQVALGPNGQMIAVEDSRPALIRVHGEEVGAFRLLKRLCAECESGQLSALRSRVELSDQMRPAVVLALLDCIDKADAMADFVGTEIDGDQGLDAGAAYDVARKELDRLLAYWRALDDSPQLPPKATEEK